jgi:FkbM family methyltransferase
MGVALASKGWGAPRLFQTKVRAQGATQPADQHSPQGWRCPQGTAAADQPVDTQLLNDQKVAHHPNGLTFRTAVFEDNSFGASSAQFTREKSERIESGVWEADQDPYMRKAFNSDPNCEYPLFIDGGAAFGYYSLLAMRLHSCRKVHAFNPHPRFAFAMGLNLQDNTKAQRIDSSSACINKLALAKGKGSVQFNFGYGGGIGVGSHSNAVTVPMTDLDGFFDEYVPHGMRVILIKLDVESQELEVMKGATRVLQGCRVKHWAIGIHRDFLLEPVMQILKKSGYTIDSAAKMVAGQPNGEVFAHC